jgi:pentatricopeptide repeat protein
MLPRCSLATRQLELLLLSTTPAFLLPSFHSPSLSSSSSLPASSPLPPRSRRAHVRGIATGREVGTGILSDVLVVLQEVSRAPTPSTSLPPFPPHTTLPASPASSYASNRLSQSSKASWRAPTLSRGVATASAAALLRADEEVDGELPVRVGRKGKGRVRRSHVTEGIEAVCGVPVEDPALRTLDDPPTLDPPLLSSIPPAPSHTPSSIILATASSSWSTAFTHPPTTRSELLRLLHNVPPSASQAQILSLRRIIFGMGRLDDSAAMGALGRAAVACGLERVGLRLLKESSAAMVRAGRAPQSIAWMFEGVIQQLGNRGRWGWVVSYSSAAMAANALSPTILRSRMRALYEEKRYAETVGAFELYRGMGVEPDGDAYDEVVGAHLLNGNLPAAQEALGAKASKGFGTTVRTCLALLDGMGAFGGNRVMEEKLLNDPVSKSTLKAQQALRQDPRLLNRIISVRAARGDTTDALAILFDHFNLKSLPFSLALPDLAAPFSLHTIRAGPRSPYWRPSPDIATFTILIGISLRRRRLDSAISLFMQSQEYGLGLNEHLVAALVRTLLVRGDVAGAEQLVFDLPSGAAKLVWRDYSLVAFEPTALVFEVLIGGVLREKGLQGLSALLNRMVQSRKSGVEVTEGTVAALVSYLTKHTAGSSKTSTNFVVRMQTLTNGLRKPTIKNLNALLELVWRRERFSGAFKGNRRSRTDLARAQLVDIASDDPILRSPHVVPSAMARIQRSLSDRSITPDRQTSQQVLRNDAHNRSINSMWDLVQTQLVDRGMKPSYHHFTIIMRAYIQLGDTSGARATIQRAVELGVERHVSMYSVLIGGAAKLGQMEVVRSAYAEMQVSGLVPDLTLYAALAMVCARRRDVAGVESIISDASTLLSPPLSPIDPIFVSILYRALVSSNRLFAAQLLIRRKLAAGLIPDTILIKALARTGKWWRRKTGRVRRGDLSPVQRKTGEYYQRNYKRARKAFRRANPREGVGALKRMEGILSKGRKGRRGRGEEEVVVV